MKFFAIILGLVWTPVVFSCPNLQGNFQCPNGPGNQLTLQIEQSEANQSEIYSFTKKNETYSYIADGKRQYLDVDEVDYVATCPGDVLQIVYYGIGSDGELDTYSWLLDEHKNLVFQSKSYPKMNFTCTRVQ